MSIQLSQKFYTEVDKIIPSLARIYTVSIETMKIVKDMAE